MYKSYNKDIAIISSNILLGILVQLDYAKNYSFLEDIGNSYQTELIKILKHTRDPIGNLLNQ